MSIPIPVSVRRASVQMPKLDAVTGKIGQFGQWATNQNWQGYGQFVTNSDFGQRVLVMNPMHMVQLSSKTKSRLVKVVEFCRNASEKWFSHWLLLVVLILYALIGAWVFVMIEGGAEMEVKAPVIDMKERIKRDIWYLTHTKNVPRSQLDSVIDSKLAEYESQLFSNFRAGLGGDSSTIRWTFWSSVVYCFTVFTTIGYGNVAPVTRIGRIATIFYACIGIPLLLMVLADLGKLFTRAVKYVLKTIRSILYAKRLKGVRRAGRRATMAQQNITQTLKSHGMKFIADVKDRRNSGRHSAAPNDSSATDGPSGPTGDHMTHSITVTAPDPPAVTVTSPTTPFMYPTATVTGPNGEPIVLLSPGICPSGRSSPLGVPATPILDASGNIIGGEVDDEFNLPVSVALIILFLYMILGAIIFMHTDDWTFVDSIYFVFISISTVGFGDLTPASEWCMIALSVYLLFGLALTSMCINVIQEQLAVAFEEAKLRLGNTMGFEVDPNTQLDPPPEDGAGPGSGTLAKKTTGSSESNDNKNIKKGGDKKVDVPEIHVEPSFDLQKEAIGKNWKERRDNKKRTDPVQAPAPAPSFSSFANQYQSPDQSISRPGQALDASGPPLTPKRTRSSSNTRRNNVNFNQ